MKQNVVKSIAFAAICMILGILIALQMKNVNNDNLTENNLAALQNRLIDVAKKNEELTERNNSLYELVQLLEDDMATGNDQVQAIIAEKERAAIFAGLREVRNYGIEIQISCNPDMKVSATILRSFINELRGIGAQALAVNDERIVAMSEIRDSGDNIVINGNAMIARSRFTIKAITNPENERYIVDYLMDMRDTIANSIQYESYQYDIQINVMPEMTIPALSEQSTAFKIDLLMQN
ncbi:MAG: DUF881 domain-containing protein [Saccharofermentanales bacterium]|jgi:uncharacterized protein YlxW (UPF0749 family)|nr:DUF881 domain-containing protein [Clostridiaceae bacterium]